MTFVVTHLIPWRASEIVRAGGDLFLGLPEKWLDDPHFFCENGHVSRVILKGDGDRCLACYNPVILGPPIGEQEFALVLNHLRKVI